LEQPVEFDRDCWRGTPLPYLSNLEPAAFSIDDQPIGRAWLRVRYVVPQNWENGEALVIYVPRVNGWGWLVRADNQVLADNFDNWRMTWNTPVSARMAPETFHPGQTIDVLVGVIFVPNVGFSSARITVAPASVVGPSLAIRQFLQISMPQACSIVLLLTGGFFFSFWLSRRKESAHLLLALATVAWCVSNLQYVLPRQDDPVLEGWYGAITNMSVSWFMWLVYLFVLRFDSRRVRWIEWALPIYVATMSLLAIPLSGLMFEASVLINTANSVVAGLVTALVCVRAVRGGNTELRVIAVTLTLAFAAGVHDVALLDQLVNPESIYLLPYSGLLVFGSFLFAVQRRYARAIDDHEILEASLASRLDEQEEELTANHTRLRELERKQTLVSERQRLMHDMHDGIGSSLLSALAASEQQDLPPNAVAKILRACIDDLRLVIDSLDPTEHDLVTLLATIRYRLGQQLDAAGLALDWDIDDVPQLAWMESSDALHILRIVQEALANVIKHANSQRVRIATRSTYESIEIIIEDMGCGFDPEANGQGRGLRNLSRRAAQLGGELKVISSPGRGTVLSLTLPVTKA
jgi:signal transduction histidine kinase